MSFIHHSAPNGSTSTNLRWSVAKGWGSEARHWDIGGWKVGWKMRRKNSWCSKITLQQNFLLLLFFFGGSVVIMFSFGVVVVVVVVLVLVLVFVLVVVFKHYPWPFLNRFRFWLSNKYPSTWSTSQMNPWKLPSVPSNPLHSIILIGSWESLSWFPTIPI